jgi:hypothetical protein
MSLTLSVMDLEISPGKKERKEERKNFTLLFLSFTHLLYLSERTWFLLLPVAPECF